MASVVSATTCHWFVTVIVTVVYPCATQRAIKRESAHCFDPLSKASDLSSDRLITVDPYLIPVESVRHIKSAEVEVPL
jgi:hypothetical protein